MTQKLKSKLAGFTLIELLVVIGIIAIFASIALVAANQARMSARDKARIADIEQLQVAFKLYAYDKGYFPCEVASDCTGQSEGANGPVGEGGYIDDLIEPYSTGGIAHDPKGPGDSTYRYYYDGYHACGSNYKAVLMVTSMETGQGNYNTIYPSICSSLDTEGRGANSNVYYIILGASSD